MPSEERERYAPLLTEDPEYLDTKFNNTVGKSTRRYGHFIYWVVVGVQTLVILVLLSTLWHRKGSLSPSHVVYSPAEDALELMPVKFSMGVGKQTTVYQGDPSEAVDQAWEALYNDYGVTKIPKSQAVHLPNKTLPMPGEEDHYVVGLSVFHQLHCLNIIRRVFKSDYYSDPVTGAIAGVLPEDLPEHISHCIDNIRQALMCSADISLIVWQWSDVENAAVPRMDTMHSCRNFDRVLDWAKSHKVDKYDRTIQPHIHGAHGV